MRVPRIPGGGQHEKPRQTANEGSRRPGTHRHPSFSVATTNGFPGRCLLTLTAEDAEGS